MKTVEEQSGLQRPPLRRGQSITNLDELVKKLTQEPIPLLTDSEDNNDLKAAIAKLSSGSILHTEKRAIERLLAQRYEDALAIAAAATSEQGGAEALGGASEVLRQVLVVFRQNNLPTELDRSGLGEPAEWRVRTHEQRRRVFLVVRSMVRLKREVKRLSAPITDLGWLVPVAAQERWGELKALAARYRQLEGELLDTEVAVSQLAQLRDGNGKAPASSRNTAGGRASPQRALRSGPGRSGGQGTGGRAVSESGAMNLRSKPRTALTADPPPPPIAGVRGGRRHGSVPESTSGGAGAGSQASTPLLLPLTSPGSNSGMAALRTPLNGKKGGAGGSDGVVISSGGGAVGPSAATSALVPTISAQRSGSNSALSGLYSTRLSISGGSTTAGGVGAAGGILSGTVSLPPPNGVGSAAHARVSAPGTGLGPAPPSSAAAVVPTVSPRFSQRDPTLSRSVATLGCTQMARQPFLTGDGGPVPSALPRVAQILDLTTYNPNAPHNISVPLEPERRPSSVNTSTSAPVSMLLCNEQQTPLASPTTPTVPRKPDTVPNGTGSAVQRSNGAGAGAGGGRPVEPSPPSAPPPIAGARRPLGPLSHSSPAPLTMGAAAGAALAVVRSMGVTGHGDAAGAAPAAAPVGGAVAAPPSAAGPPVLIQDGESLEQALGRFKLLAEDTRNALVDTARQFRNVVDLCNSAWPDQRWWLAAHTQDDAALDTWPTSDEYVVHRADMVRCLKAGAVAFQFMCYSDEPLVGPTGNRFDLWTSDPWEVAADLLGSDRLGEAQGSPQRPSGERMVGLPLGVRVLQQLANSVAEAASPQALDLLPIILHISERQREVIAADLLQYDIYRRLRKNLYIVVQRTHPVMRYSAADHAYLPASDQPEHTPGTGYSMLQLLWPGHALYVNESGELERLPHSIMQELRDRSTEWFVSRSGQDLSLLLEDGPLDMRSLAHISYMVKGERRGTMPICGHQDCNCISLSVPSLSSVPCTPDPGLDLGGSVPLSTAVMSGFASRGRVAHVPGNPFRMHDSPSHRAGNQGYGRWNTAHMRYSVVVEAASTYVKHRDMILQHGSVLLCRKPKVSGMVVGRLDGAVRVDRYGGATKPQLPVVELLACELNSAHMQEELTQVATARATATSVGIGRQVRGGLWRDGLETLYVPTPYLRHRVTLQAVYDDNAPGWSALTGGQANAMFPFPTPGGLNEQQLSFAASQGLDTLLLRLHLSMTDLTMHHASKDGQKLVEVLVASDRDLSGAAERLAAKLPSFTRQQKPGQNILVFVQDNSVSLTATNVAAGLVRRERGDRVHLVTVVPTEAQRSEGTGLMERLLKAFRTHADVTTHVLSQDGRGLLECLGDVVTQQRCGLIVAGSTSITAVAVAAPRNVPLVLPGVAPGKQPATAQGAGGTAGRGGGGVGAQGMQDDGSSEVLLSSVALSILRTFSLPVILVTANTRTYLKRHGLDPVAGGGRPARHPVGGVGGATSGRLAAMVVVERHSRPMMHHLARCLLEPSLRQDTLTLVQVLPPGMAPGNPGYDPSSIHCVALKTLVANFESISAANDFHTPNKVFTQGEWYSALCIAARDYGAQLLSVQLAPGSTKSLPPLLLQLIRSAPCPVLVYPEKAIVPGASELTEGEHYIVCTACTLWAADLGLPGFAEPV
ncbi:hypothetical protein VOLCADRAFT_94176 [Volvox carteri f. nagariensis]|uniref:Uncharacterized protein n=1 Tax=Volvox carteri f. nagariensis TaxID=3068 RepID=D8U4C3_VOLCA|nr:uncharacterized protein VOLCADRAFT_94176 [Volvox carteri f. nagariensis]EFJ45379.1 hypothetical protein VOLCADRAFT_94176 [Volvox carteri f. nagariensis]|eukprot:XP_002953406.1 hypothetical protein VOLCADRAFT_94176 [Volvox carteri f. nagariensis]